MFRIPCADPDSPTTNCLRRLSDACPRCRTPNPRDTRTVAGSGRLLHGSAAEQQGETGEPRDVVEKCHHSPTFRESRWRWQTATRYSDVWTCQQVRRTKFWRTSSSSLSRKSSSRRFSRIRAAHCVDLLFLRPGKKKRVGSPFRGWSNSEPTYGVPKRTTCSHGHGVRSKWPIQRGPRIADGARATHGQTSHLEKVHGMPVVSRLNISIYSRKANFPIGKPRLSPLRIPLDSGFCRIARRRRHTRRTRRRRNSRFDTVICRTV